MQNKLKNLRHTLKEMKGILLAYSGGVDSTFLLKIAQEELGDKVMAVTIKTETQTPEEIIRAKKITRQWGIKHLIKDLSILTNREFAENPLDRCYICKKQMFQVMQEIARVYNLGYLVDGSNYSDLNEFRPGIKALKELKVRSPLQEVALSKEEIRLISKAMNLTVWNQPSNSCLATRIPYHEEITLDKLERIAKAEYFLHQLGITQVRVRCHDKLARIEVTEKDIPLLIEKTIRGKIISQLRKTGFTYFSLDLAGYTPQS